MIQVYNNPLLLDFVKCAILMPQDERDQVRAFSGEEFDIDGCAVGCYTQLGPKWVAKDDNEPLVVGGFVPQRPGVWRDFLLTTPNAWLPGNAFRITLGCRRVMNAMFKSGEAHRLECIVPESRISSRPELVEWYRVLGYQQEATLRAYLADGSNAVVFARVGH
jgi:hypothetical protein